MQGILTCVWLEYEPLSYDGAGFPFWATIVGWALSATPLVVITLTGLVMFCRAEGSLAQRWQQLLCPEDDWGPALAVHRAEYYPLQIPEARKIDQVHYNLQQTAHLLSETDLRRRQASREPSHAYSRTFDERETII